MIIAIDFDGTIVENKFPGIGKPKPNAKKVINFLHDGIGARIIIWTVRTAKNDIWTMRQYLDSSGIKYDAINDGRFVPFLNSPKIYADIYIDDRQAGGLPQDWDKIWKLIAPQVRAINKRPAGTYK